MNTTPTDSSKTNHHQQRRWSLTPSSMSRTLWSDERSPVRDSSQSAADNDDDNKDFNLQVVLRCRPPSEDELRGKTPLIISCDDLKQQVKVIHASPHKQIDKTYVFDQVFGPESEQKDLYDSVVSPVITDVLEGFSWTILAYGQTGSGKTYTMEGEGRKSKNGEFESEAGVIPRAMRHIFDELKRRKSDYSMKVTFLELYNEEITDLLIPDDEHDEAKKKAPLVLMEDGRGAVFVRGLEEINVSNEDEVYSLLERGSSKKHTAETLLHKRSNRSHSIFTVTVRVGEMDPNGLELVKCGKLSLVDLAGSENILRSGAREARAREAGEINKSLLTLGRVINALYEKASHVPYRESKLTRLLRDSLGGKTKTCIIATVSPSFLSMEETLNTLDYASRAKTIKNKPEVNQRVVKSLLVQNLQDQIDRLKNELYESREKNGVTLCGGQKRDDESTKKLLEMKELYIYQQKVTSDLKDKLENTEKELIETRGSLSDMEDRYRKAKSMNTEKEDVIRNLLRSGDELKERALGLRSDLETAASDITKLFSKIEQKNYLESRNKHQIQNFNTQLAQLLDELHNSISISAARQEQSLKLIQENTQSSLSSKALAMDELVKKIRNLSDSYGSGINHLSDTNEELFQNSRLVLHKLSTELSAQSTSVINLFKKISSDSDISSNDLKINLNSLGTRISAFTKQQEENHMRFYEISKSISQSLVNVFKILSISSSKLKLMEEDSQAITQQKLTAFAAKFEELALEDDRLLLEKISEMLASSSARKNNMIQTMVNDMVESSCKRTDNLHREISKMQSLTSEAKKKCKSFVDETEDNYVKEIVITEAARGMLESHLQCCISNATEVAEQWSAAEDSLQRSIEEKSEGFDIFMMNGTEDKYKIREQYSSLASSILEETDAAGKDLIFSAECMLRVDREESQKINDLSENCQDNVQEMISKHSARVVEISANARKALIEDYVVDDDDDEDSCYDVNKRNFNLHGKEYIENIIKASVDSK